MTTEYLDIIGKATENITNDSYQLESLAHAFSTTGNFHVAEQLHAIAEGIRSDSKNIHKAIGINVSDQLQTSMNASDNMLRACLAGVQIGKGDVGTD